MCSQLRTQVPGDLEADGSCLEAVDERDLCIWNSSLSTPSKRAAGRSAGESSYLHPEATLDFVFSSRVSPAQNKQIEKILSHLYRPSDLLECVPHLPRFTCWNNLTPTVSVVRLWWGFWKVIDLRLSYKMWVLIIDSPVNGISVCMKALRETLLSKLWRHRSKLPSMGPYQTLLWCLDLVFPSSIV